MLGVADAFTARAVRSATAANVTLPASPDIARENGRSTLDINKVHCHAHTMRAWFIWRLVAVLSVLALLLTGFAATSVAANAPCDMAMPAAASGAPCDDHGMPDGPKKALGATVCFAKCPMPCLDQVTGLPVLAHTEQPAQVPRPHPAQTGISVIPPLEPPRA